MKGNGTPEGAISSAALAHKIIIMGSGFKPRKMVPALAIAVGWMIARHWRPKDMEEPLIAFMKEARIHAAKFRCRLLEEENKAAAARKGKG